MKDRVTLTIDTSLLKRIDSSIDGTRVKNRSHAVELLLRQALKGDLPTQAVILAGGTAEGVEHNLVPLNGKPILQHNIEMLTASGVQHIIIITKDAEKIKAGIDETAFKEVHLQYITEANALGTAGALHLAKPYLQGTFIVTNGDDFKEVNIREMFDFHKDNQGWCTLALTSVANPHEYGVALLNGNRIVTFVEKPQPEHAPSNLISAGFYLMEPEVLNFIPSGYGKIEIDVFPKLASEDKLFGYPFPGIYEDLQ